MSAAAGVPFGTDAERRAQDGAADARATGTSRGRFMSITREAFRDRNTTDADILGFPGANVFETNEAETNRGDTPAEMFGTETEFRHEMYSAIRAARLHVKGASKPSEKTKEDYTKKSERMFNAAANIDGDQTSTWMHVFSKYARVSNSFFAMRAAAAWHCRQKIRELLSSQCSMQRRDGLTRSWMETVRQATGWVDQLNTIEGIEREELLVSTGQKHIRKRSKREELPAMPDGWRESVVAASQKSEVYADAMAALSLTGCRPEELCRGVTVQLDHDRAIFKVRGVKISECAGQPSREIDVDWRALPSGLLAKLRGSETVHVGIWSTAGLRSHLVKISQSLFRKGPRVTPYFFRHALAEDLREGGWPPEEIGAALGHRVGETSAHYGRRRRPGQGRGGVKPISLIRGGVRATFPVQPRIPYVSMPRPMRQQP